jgi:hypothetical protein
MFQLVAAGTSSSTSSDAMPKAPAMSSTDLAEA